MSYEFKAYPKIPRLNKLQCSITEKLDGTNGIISIQPIIGDQQPEALAAGAIAIEKIGFLPHAIFAGSRTRWLDPSKKDGDNYGFGKWVQEHSLSLALTLGPGTHYGEWWGQGIQRNYDQQEKRFTLFNPWRYPNILPANSPDAGGELLDCVPILWMGSLEDLKDGLAKAHDILRFGSVAAPDFTNPEGFVVHVGDRNYKVIVNEGDKAGSRG